MLPLKNLLLLVLMVDDVVPMPVSAYDCFCLQLTVNVSEMIANTPLLLTVDKYNDKKIVCVSEGLLDLFL